MKRILFFTLSAVLMFAACQKPSQYLINGKASSDFEGKTVYLKALKNMAPDSIILDSAVITGGVFTLKKSVPVTDLYNLSVKGERMSINMFVANNDTIQVNLEKGPGSLASGNALNNDYNNYTGTVIESVKTKMQGLQQQAQAAHMEAQQANKNIDPKIEAQLDSTYKAIMDQLKADQKKFVEEHPTSLVSAYVIRTINDLPVEEMETYVAKFDEAAGKSALVSELKETIANIRNTEIGKMFVDIKLNNPEGKLISLSDYAGKGKYVLIDFWASWCGPCRAENPNVVALYNKYKDKGFEIVGVSLDAQKDAWLKGIAEDGITWPQMSDLKAWQSVGAKLYHVRSIPATVLLDKDGKILAKDLRGEELAAKLVELLGA